MPDRSQRVDSLPDRQLRQEEIALISSLLSRTSVRSRSLRDSLRSSRVRDMNDGNMGSIRFVRDGSRKYGKTLAEAKYIDFDGVLVSISLNADDNGELFEVDFWKVDFSPLKRYPNPSDLRE